MLVATVALVRRRGTSAALKRLAPDSYRRSRPIDPAAATVAVQRAGRLLRARCLAQSVALVVVLQRAGRDAIVVLGCRRYEDRRWGSHAWVVCGGEILEPVMGGDHAELARYSAAQGWVPVAPPSVDAARDDARD